MLERLQKILASTGIASRRKAEEFLQLGRVSVNGSVAKLGDSADTAKDLIEIDGKPIVQTSRQYWLLNKPSGLISTCSDPQGRGTVLQCLPERALGQGLFPVGRLDRDSEGLLLLTNDGDSAHVLLHPSFRTKRVYRVSIRGEFDEIARRRLEEGIFLDQGEFVHAEVERVEEGAEVGTWIIWLALREGRKRQIRRSMGCLGFRVLKLLRTEMGPLKLGDLKRGKARPLTEGERRILLEYVTQARLD